MKLSFRWYGTSDPISLEYIRQIPNMRSIVSAVYDVKPGEVWPEESLAEMKRQVEASGMLFDIVESVPVPEEIKLGTADADTLTEVYCENIRRCAKYGIKCITYNFMPVFDWTRTQLDKKAPDGSTSLVMYWEQMKHLDPLTDDIHLPGWDARYTQDQVRELIRAYGELGEEGLWKNLERFLKKIIPVAEEYLQAGNPPLFAEPQYQSAALKAISQETGAPVYTLDPLVTGPDSLTAYEDGMRRNLSILLEALGNQ